MITTTSPLKTIEAIRRSAYLVALYFTKTTSETMRMEFDATAVVSVTVDGVEYMVKVSRSAVGGVAMEEDEKSGCATLNVALDKALGEGVTRRERHGIEREIYRTAGLAFDDADDALTAKGAGLVNAVRAAEALGDANLRGMLTELLVRALLERHTHVLNALSGIRGLAHLVSSGRLPDSSLSEVLREFATVYSRVKRSTGVRLEALRKASEVPVTEIGNVNVVADLIDTLYADVVLP
ncbi:hypothetical protein [Cupriavidus malaysiensis]|uniref:ENT domain-containing protein n=1 Tax=Cupriavidus malaysiensis TaxID=367825 RepID=A0ABM6F3C5_9BURK|nr:hypothetical protein [Cupriavidus malaysiensis]AOZ05902.1 hypothetical protein BKK80_08760 [Cupriavidus malaysiensis]